MESVANAGIGSLSSFRRRTKRHTDAVHWQRLQVAQAPGKVEKILRARADDRRFRLAIDEPTVIAFDITVTEDRDCE